MYMYLMLNLRYKGFDELDNVISHHELYILTFTSRNKIYLGCSARSLAITALVKALVRDPMKNRVLTVAFLLLSKS